MVDLSNSWLRHRLTVGMLMAAVLGACDPEASSDAEQPGSDAGSASRLASAAPERSEPLPDRDGDGWIDADDPAPDDAAKPGDFSTPEAILMDGRVKRALDAAQKAGYPLRPSLARSPRDPSGLFRQEDRAGRFVATSNGADVGIRLAGAELNLTVYGDLTLDAAAISFTGGKPTAFSVSQGAQVRGTDEVVTTYTRTKQTCTLAGADFTVWSVGVSTDSEAKGATPQTVSLRVTIGTAGELNSACADYLVANVEEDGGWSAAVVPSARRITPSEAQFMCKDAGAAYVPTQRWTRKDGTSCECTKDYAVSCER